MLLTCYIPKILLHTWQSSLMNSAMHIFMVSSKEWYKIGVTGYQCLKQVGNNDILPFDTMILMIDQHTAKSTGNVVNLLNKVWVLSFVMIHRLLQNIYWYSCQGVSSCTYFISRVLSICCLLKQEATGSVVCCKNALVYPWVSARKTSSLH